MSMANEISPEAIMAFALLKARRSGDPVQIEGLSKLFFEIRQRGLEEVERVALRRVPGGFYSEDVEAFLGRLLAAGYARARSPVTVDDNGENLCKEILRSEMESHPDALRRVADALGFEMSLAV
jgi:hypothetical protein